MFLPDVLHTSLVHPVYLSLLSHVTTSLHMLHSYHTTHCSIEGSNPYHLCSLWRLQGPVMSEMEYKKWLHLKVNTPSGFILNLKQKVDMSEF